MGKMRIIGLTGGCGTGKSTVAGILAEKGGYIIDADKLTVTLQKPGAAAYEEIVKWLGEEYLLPDGNLNRRKIAELVFQDKQALRKLNAIVHTKVAEEIKSSVAAIESAHDDGFVVLDVPIPVERGFLDTADVIWVVSANDDLRVERLMERMNISENEAVLRINNQMSNREYEELADVVIENEKGIDELRWKVEEALE